MPYIKKEPDKLRRVFLAYELDGVKLARILGYHPNTGRDRMKNPDALTVAEIRQISRKAHIPIEELRGAI